jgi:GDP-4-dehydro-6-deoxy-D-mannose reductase
MARPTALITGITGFAGSWLAEELLTNGYEVAGTRLAGESTENVKHIKPGLKLITLDILNANRCRKVIEQVRPKYIFHLAALASVGNSLNQEALTLKVNIDGALNILRAASTLGKKLTKLVFVSSADCYGLVKSGGRPIRETEALNPTSPYGISKAAGEGLCRYYQRVHGVPAVVARAFNHSGPRQIDTYVIPSFAHQIAMIEAGQMAPVLKVGNLSVQRDFSDVRDIVAGYRLLAEKAQPGEAFNLGSGQAVSIQNMLDMLLAESSADIKVRRDRLKYRPADIPILKASIRKVTQEHGFRRRYSLRKTLVDTLNYYRNRLR